jgi:hypothetical protein
MTLGVKLAPVGRRLSVCSIFSFLEVSVFTHRGQSCFLAYKIHLMLKTHVEKTLSTYVNFLNVKTLVNKARKENWNCMVGVIRTQSYDFDLQRHG